LIFSKRRFFTLRRKKPDSFTLIELLIVVAIISILSSIAVPNFLEAQARAKVSRAKADMASIGTALEIYATDHNNYPWRRAENWESDSADIVPPFKTKHKDLQTLTTPVRYMVSLPADIFDVKSDSPLNVYNYFDPEQTNIFASNQIPREPPCYCKPNAGKKLWMLLSVGPDGFIGVLPSGRPGGYPKEPPISAFSIIQEYDPNNGTISRGNIYRIQGGTTFSQMIAAK